jgi:ketosteroid isomerase-like protein
MESHGAATARSFLDRFEAGIAARDSLLNAMCTDDVVLFGSSLANFGREKTDEYLRLVVEGNTVRWHLDQWAVLHETEAQHLVAAEGQVESDDGTGPERSPFRLTLWLVREDEDWKIRHFHGSVPEL